MEDILNNLSQMIVKNIWFAPLLALFAGIISSFSPCGLTSVPLIIGYVGGYGNNDKKRAIKYSIAFSLGLTAMLTTLGGISALLGKLLTGAGRWWILTLGILMMIVGLQLIGVLNIIPDACKIPSERKGMLGAFFLGILGGIFSSPCATPVLIVILAFVSTQGSILLGMILLALYSFGHCALIMLAGTSLGLVQKLTSSQKTQKIGNLLKIVFGILTLIFSFYLFYLGF